MVVSRGLAGFSRGREHLAVVSRAVVTVVVVQSCQEHCRAFEQNSCLVDNVEPEQLLVSEQEQRLVFEQEQRLASEQDK